MRTTRRHLLVCFSVVLLLAGCGDDDASTPDAGTPADQCLGAGDIAILEPLLADAGVGLNTGIVDILLTCGQTACSNEILSGDRPAAESCMHDCYVPTSLAGLSAGCELCWTGSVLCAAQFCPIVCLGSDPDACVACVTENCVDQQNHCTGL